MEELQKEIEKLKKKNTVLQGIISNLRNKESQNADRQRAETSDRIPTRFCIVFSCRHALPQLLLLARCRFATWTL